MQADKPLYWEPAPPKMTILDDQLENENKPKNDDDPKIKTNPKWECVSPHGSQYPHLSSLTLKNEDHI